MAANKRSAVSYTAVDVEPSAPTEKSTATKTPATQRWRPFWMRRSVLILFIFCFAALLAGLEILNHFSNVYDGIASTTTSYHYLWTYGPTAILTLFLALWNRVDYRIRQMAPWTHLYEQPPANVDKNLRLDYVSPTSPEILWKSLSNHDFIVSASTIITNLIVLLIVLSTSLLALVERPIVLENVPYRTTLDFVNNASAFYADGARSTAPGNVIDAIDLMNLSYPFGLTPDHAYQTFECQLEGLPSNAMQSAIVDVLVFDLECQEAEVSNNASYRVHECPAQSPYLYSSTNWTAGNCSIDDPLPVSLEKNGDGRIGYFGAFDYLACHEDSPDGLWDYRLLVGFGKTQQLGNIRTDSQVNCSGTYSWVNYTIVQSKQWLCRPSFYALPGTVAFNPADILAGRLPSITVDESAQRRFFDKVDFASYPLDQLRLISSADLMDDPAIELDGGLTSNKLFYRVLRGFRQEQINDMFDTDQFLTLFQKYFKRAMSLITHMKMTAQDSRGINGTATILQDRLKTRTVPLRAMQGVLGSVLVLAVYILWCLPRDSITARDPAQLSHLVRMLASCPCSTHHVHHIDGPPTAWMRQPTRIHGNCTFPRHSYESGLFGSAAKCKTANDPRSPHPEVLQTVWWRPLTIAPASRIVAGSVVIALIVTLQVLLQVSDHDQGFVTLPASSSSLAWSIPAGIVMTLVAMYFKALNFVYKVFDPYCELRKGPNAKSSSQKNHLSMTEVEVLADTIRNLRAALFLSTFSAVLASFLTIAVSGVFLSRPVPLIFEADVAQGTWFRDTGSTDNGTADNNGPIAGLILTSNLSYPAWTYENLAFASLKADNNQYDLVVRDSTEVSFSTVVPAIRSSLNCSLYEQEDFEGLKIYQGVSASDDSYQDTQVYMYANKFGDDEVCTGGVNDSVVVVFITMTTNGTGTEFSSFFNNTTPGCPLLNYYWGHHRPGKQSGGQVLPGTTALRGLACYETTERVDVETTLTYPDLRFDLTRPPRIRDNTAELFSTALTNLSYGALPNPSYNPSVINFGDPFWEAARTHFGLSDYGNPAMTSQIVEALKYSHGIVRAQQYNAALRTTDLLNSAMRVKGTITDSTRQRLTVDKTSASILSGLLGLMLICGLVAGLLIRTKEVLPENPSSIAATARLLVDSNILKASQAEADEAFATGHLKMGWFHRSTDNESVYTINIVNSAGLASNYIAADNSDIDIGASSLTSPARDSPEPGYQDSTHDWMFPIIPPHSPLLHPQAHPDPAPAETRPETPPPHQNSRSHVAVSHQSHPSPHPSYSPSISPPDSIT